MTARARLAAYVGSLEDLTLFAVQVMRAGAKRFNDYYLLSLCDAALLEFITGAIQ